MGPVRVIVPNVLLEVWKDLEVGEKETLENPLQEQLITLAVHKEKYTTTFEVNDAAVYHTATELVCDLTNPEDRSADSDSEASLSVEQQRDWSMWSDEASESSVMETEAVDLPGSSLRVLNTGCRRTDIYSSAPKKLRLTNIITTDADSLSHTDDPADNTKSDSAAAAPTRQRKQKQRPPEDKRVTRGACFHQPPVTYRNTRSDIFKPLPIRPIQDLELEYPPKDGDDEQRCLLCGLLFARLAGFKTHLKIHHEVKYIEHLKLWTDYKTADKRRVGLEDLRAISMERLKASWRVCHVCFVPCPNLKVMMHHMGSHSTHVEYNSIIQQIQDQMRSKRREDDSSRSFEVKIKTEDDEASSFVMSCPICDQNFQVQSGLKYHLKNVHKISWSSYSEIFGAESIKTEEEREQIRERLLESMKTQKMYYREEEEEEVESITGSEPVSLTGSEPKAGSSNTSEKKLPIYLKPMVLVELKDEALALLDEDYMGCLLCGKSWMERTSLKHHLYTAHKVIYTEQRNVLLEENLLARKEALESLRENSRDQMRHSGKHCPICFGQSVKSDVLFSHMEMHSDHPQYEFLLQQMHQVIDTSKQIGKPPQKHKKSPESKYVRCVICDKDFLYGERLRKHVSNFHEYSWVNYMRIISTPEKDRLDEIQEIKNSKFSKTYAILNPVNYDGRAKNLIIQCVFCNQGIPCEDYRTHLENFHPKKKKVPTATLR